MKNLSNYLIILFVICLLPSCDYELEEDVLPENLEFPNVTDDEYTTFANGSIRLQFLSNDNLRSQVSLKVGSPKNGEINSDTAGTYFYHPKKDYIGEDSIDYVICKGSKCDTGKVKIKIKDPKDCKTTVGDDYYPTIKNQPVVLNPLSNDSICGDILSFTILSTPEHGKIDSTNNIFIYTPDAEDVGNEVLKYQVGVPNPDPGSGDVLYWYGRIYIAINDTTGGDTTFCLVANRDEIFVLRDDTVIYDILANDSYCSPIYTMEIHHNRATFTDDRKLLYYPAPGFIGVETLQYTVCTSPTACTIGIIEVKVDGIDPPTGCTAINQAVNDTFNLETDSAGTHYTQWYLDVTSNDILCPESATTYEIKVSRAPSSGTATVIDGKTILYTNTSGQPISEDLEYEFCFIDGPKICTRADVSINFR